MTPNYGIIERSFVNSFKEGYQEAFQQKMSKLRPLVEVVSQRSEFDFFDRIGLAEKMQEVTTRYGDTPQNEVLHERRRNSLKDFDWGRGVDDKDLIRVVSDPTNEYTRAAVYAANRQIDEIILSCITAPAYVGKAGETVVNFVGNTAGKITVGEVSNENKNIKTGGQFAVTSGLYEGVNVASDYSPTGTSGTHTNITTDKLIAIRETLLSLEAIESGTMLPMIVSPNQQSALLRESGNKVISADYNTERTLVNGVVDTWLGFRFIYSNLLPKNQSTGIRSCYVLGPQAIKLGIGYDISVDIFRRPDKKNIPWIYLKMGMGGTRMWGEHTVQVLCDETK